MPGPTSYAYNNPFGMNSAAPVQGGGGGGGDSTMGSLRRMAPGEVPEPFFRDDMDFQRAMYRRVPSAEYPDGYLGTMRFRRDDRLMANIQGRLNQRQYQRGVHKGERIDPGDYFWQPDFNPRSGLEREAQGLRWAPAETLVTRSATQERQMIPRGSQSLIEVSPERQAQLRHLAPSWR